MDYLFIGINIVAVWSASRHTSRPIQVALWSFLALLQTVWSGLFDKGSCGDEVFKNELPTPADYALFPAWQFQSTAPGFGIGAGLLKLLTDTLVLFGSGWWRLHQ